MTFNVTECTWEKGLGGAYPGLMSAVYIAVIIVLFIAIAIVCDDYFVPSLEVICKRLDLSEDVAGATFMAAGSSAPELFTSLAAVTNDSDIGVGTIVGSAVFNILIIISLSAILCRNVLLLDWRPLTRDAFFYGLSIILFSALAWDGMFTWWESMITLLYYFLYILSMKFNRRVFQLLDLFRRIFCCITRQDVQPNTDNTSKVSADNGDLGPKVQITPPSDTNTSYAGYVSLMSEWNDISYRCSEGGDDVLVMKGLGVPASSMKRAQSSGSSGIGSMTDDPPLHTEPEELWKPKDIMKTASMESVNMDDASAPNQETPPEVIITAAGENEEEDEEYDEVTVCCCSCAPKVMTSLPASHHGRFSCIRQILGFAYFLIAFPFQTMFSFTIPNSLKPHLQKYYLFSFAGSVLWIAVLSYAMVVLVERFGCIIGIDQYVMGLVVVAAGTSVPDALSSVIVAREGHGDMAVSNALGSNVFDINLGLGLPFLIKTIIQSKPLTLIDDVEGNAGFLMPHTKFGIILFGILLSVYVIIALNKFKLNRCIGLIFILIYLAFIAYALMQELLCNGVSC